MPAITSRLFLTERCHIGDFIMNEFGQTGKKLAELITNAIKDGKVTEKEYFEIVTLANADQLVDSQEKRLLNQLEDMIRNNAVLKVMED